MGKTIPSGLRILAGGAVSGVGGVVLFSDAGAGLNVVLFTGIVAGAVAAFDYTAGSSRAKRNVPVLAGLMLCAAGFAWRDSTTLHALACGAALLVFLSLHLRSLGRRIVGCSPYRAVTELGRAVRRFFVTTPSIARAEISWNRLGGEHAALARAIGRGLLAMIPVLFVFGSLLTSADARFEAFAGTLLDFELATVLERVAIFCVCLFLAVTVIDAAVRPAKAGHEPRPGAAWRAGGIEVNIVLAALDILFLSYVVVQLSYFFGDDALVRGQPALSYSAYARRGFFELVWLSVMSLPLLFVARWLMRDAGFAAARLHDGLAGCTAALVLVIVASAMHRMQLYVDAYGLTELRFYCSVFMVFIATVYVWCCASILFGRGQRFVAGVIAGALAVVAGLYCANPDAVIARTNIDRLARTNRLDTSYLVSLSADAVPVLLETFGPGSAQSSPQLVDRVRQKTGRLPADGWRGWNRSRARARKLLVTASGGER